MKVKGLFEVGAPLLTWQRALKFQKKMDRWHQCSENKCAKSVRLATPTDLGEDIDEWHVDPLRSYIRTQLPPRLDGDGDTCWSQALVISADTQLLPRRTSSSTIDTARHGASSILSTSSSSPSL
eukprot:SRR837773.11438.p4 GENE.SRR837773.11438~~SRR837773.11438.p4  ORF type:complete len:124 (-),score=27.61 SRR837773.11438:119-490(-)